MSRSYSVLQVTPLPISSLQYVNDTDKENEPIASYETIGGILCNTKYVWTANGPHFAVINSKTASRVATCSFGTAVKDNTTKVTCVDELVRPNGKLPLLVIGLESELHGGSICIFNIIGSRVLRTIQLDAEVSSLHVINASYDKCPLPGPLRAFDGILAVGTSGGDVLLLDVYRQILDEASTGSNEIKDEVNPCFLKVILLNELISLELPKQVAIKNGEHLAIYLNATIGSFNPHFILKGPKGEDRVHVNKAEVKVSALHYCPQLGSLLVGYNFGAWQLWNLIEMRLIYTSPIYEENIPVSHFAVQEPCDDPRAFCYVWAVYSNTDSYQSGFPVAVLYSLNYDSKEWHEGYGIIYQDLTSCAVRFQTDLTFFDGKEDENVKQGAQCLRLQAINKSISKGGSLQEHQEETLSLCSVVWRCWRRLRSNVIMETYMSVFDLNQWYKEQMPSSVSSKKHETYITHVCLSKLLQSTHKEQFQFLDVLMDVDTLAQFFGSQKLEEHYYPSSLAFQLCGLTEHNIAFFNNLGRQRALLAQLESNGPVALLKPDEFFKESLHLGLHPLFVDIPNKPTLENQRELLMSVGLEQQLLSWLCKCALVWSSGNHAAVGCHLQFLLSWGWQRALVLKQNADRLSTPLFDYSGTKLDNNTHSLLSNSSRQLKNLATVFGHIIRRYTRFLLNPSIIKQQWESLEMVSIHLKVLQWLLNVGLLPECPLSSYPRMDEYNRVSAPYPVDSLIEYYNERRTYLQTANKEQFSTSGSLLFIDNIIELECGGTKLQRQWENDGGNGLYPPPSLQALLRTYLIEEVDISIKHRVIVYVFLDLAMTLDQERYKQVITHLIKFPAVFQLSPSIIKITQAFWQLDHGDFRTAMEQLLDPLVSIGDLKTWHHRIVLKALLAQDQHNFGLLYLQVRQPPITEVQDLCTVLSLFIANNMLDAALHFQRRHKSSDNEEKLLHHFYKECDRKGDIASMLYFTLTSGEEQAFFKYLERVNHPQKRDLQIFYFIQRSRYMDAFDLDDKLHKIKASNKGLKGQTSIGFCDLMLKEFTDSLPEISKSLISVCKNEKHSLWKQVERPEPLSVFVHNPTEQVKYKSTLINAVLSKAKETWTHPLLNNCNKNNRLIHSVTEETPFLNTPKATPLKSRLTTPVIFPKITNVEESELNSDHGPSPAKRLKLSPRLPLVTPEKSVSTRNDFTLGNAVANIKLDTPIIKRRMSRRSSNEKFTVGTPQSILKVNSLIMRDSRSPDVDSARVIDIYTRRSNDSPTGNEEAMTSVSKLNILSRKSSLGLSPRKPLSRHAVRFDISRASSESSLTSTASGPTFEIIEDQAIVHTSIRDNSRKMESLIKSTTSVHSIMEVGGSKNSSVSADEVFYSPNASTSSNADSKQNSELEKTIDKNEEEVLNQQEPEELALNKKEDSTYTESPRARRSYKRRSENISCETTEEIKLVVDVEYPDIKNSLSVPSLPKTPRSRKSYKGSLSEMGVRSSPRLRRSIIRKESESPEQIQTGLFENVHDAEPKLLKEKTPPRQLRRPVVCDDTELTEKTQVEPFENVHDSEPKPLKEKTPSKQLRRSVVRDEIKPSKKTQIEPFENVHDTEPRPLKEKTPPRQLRRSVVREEIEPLEKTEIEPFENVHDTEPRPLKEKAPLRQLRRSVVRDEIEPLEKTQIESFENVPHTEPKPFKEETPSKQLRRSVVRDQIEFSEKIQPESLENVGESKLDKEKTAYKQLSSSEVNAPAPGDVTQNKINLLQARIKSRRSLSRQVLENNVFSQIARQKSPSTFEVSYSKVEATYDSSSSKQETKELLTITEEGHKEVVTVNEGENVSEEITAHEESHSTSNKASDQLEEDEITSANASYDPLNVALVSDSVLCTTSGTSEKTDSNEVQEEDKDDDVNAEDVSEYKQEVTEDKSDTVAKLNEDNLIHTEIENSTKNEEFQVNEEIEQDKECSNENKDTSNSGRETPIESNITINCANIFADLCNNDKLKSVDPQLSSVSEETEDDLNKGVYIEDTNTDILEIGGSYAIPSNEDELHVVYQSEFFSTEESEINLFDKNVEVVNVAEEICEEENRQDDDDDEVQVIEIGSSSSSSNRSESEERDNYLNESSISSSSYEDYSKHQSDDDNDSDDDDNEGIVIHHKETILETESSENSNNSPYEYRESTHAFLNEQIQGIESSDDDESDKQITEDNREVEVLDNYNYIQLDAILEEDEVVPVHTVDVSEYINTDSKPAEDNDEDEVITFPDDLLEISDEKIQTDIVTGDSVNRSNQTRDDENNEPEMAVKVQSKFEILTKDDKKEYSAIVTQPKCGDSSESIKSNENSVGQTTVIENPTRVKTDTSKAVNISLSESISSPSPTNISNSVDIMDITAPRSSVYDKILKPVPTDILEKTGFCSPRESLNILNQTDILDRSIESPKTSTDQDVSKQASTASPVMYFNQALGILTDTNKAVNISLSESISSPSSTNISNSVDIMDITAPRSSVYDKILKPVPTDILEKTGFCSPRESLNILNQTDILDRSIESPKTSTDEDVSKQASTASPARRTRRSSSLQPSPVTTSLKRTRSSSHTNLDKIAIMRSAYEAVKSSKNVIQTNVGASTSKASLQINKSIGSTSSQQYSPGATFSSTPRKSFYILNKTDILDKTEFEADDTQANSFSSNLDILEKSPDFSPINSLTGLEQTDILDSPEETHMPVRRSTRSASLQHTPEPTLKRNTRRNSTASTDKTSTISEPSTSHSTPVISNVSQPEQKRANVKLTPTRRKRTPSTDAKDIPLSKRVLRSNSVDSDLLKEEVITPRTRSGKVSSVNSEKESTVDKKGQSGIRTRRASSNIELPLIEETENGESTPQLKVTKSKPIKSTLSETGTNAKKQTRKARSTISTSHNKDTLDEYSTTRRLTRRQADLLKKTFNSSEINLDLPQIEEEHSGSDSDDSESHQRGPKIDTINPINLLDKPDFEGQPDPDEVRNVQSSPTSSVPESPIDARKLRSHDSITPSASEDSYSEKSKIKSAKRVITGKYSTRKQGSRSSSVKSDDKPSPPKLRKTRRGSKESESSSDVSHISKAQSLIEIGTTPTTRKARSNSVYSDRPAAKSPVRKIGRRLLQKSELPKIDEEASKSATTESKKNLRKRSLAK